MFEGKGPTLKLGEGSRPDPADLSGGQPSVQREPTHDCPNCKHVLPRASEIDPGKSGKQQTYALAPQLGMFTYP